MGLHVAGNTHVFRVLLHSGWAAEDLEGVTVRSSEQLLRFCFVFYLYYCPSYVGPSSWLSWSSWCTKASLEQTTSNKDLPQPFCWVTA